MTRSRASRASARCFEGTELRPCPRRPPQRRPVSFATRRAVGSSGHPRRPLPHRSSLERRWRRRRPLPAPLARQQGHHTAQPSTLSGPLQRATRLAPLLPRLHLVVVSVPRLLPVPSVHRLKVSARIHSHGSRQRSAVLVRPQRRRQRQRLQRLRRPVSALEARHRRQHQRLQRLRPPG